ncbi:MAG TPA: hypothetical protein VMO00_16470 [Methylomirabilota bacterium]|nr:hypothetical protein [Methylomirabilota bacterium]
MSDSSYISRLRAKHAVRRCFVLLFTIATTQLAIAESFSIHLVHPDNDAIVSSINPDVDLSDYMKIILPAEGKDEVVWASKKVEIGLSDLFGAAVTVPKPVFRHEQPIPSITISLTPGGSRKFADFTSQNVKRRAVILLDGRGLSAPEIGAPITSGVMGFAWLRSKQEAQSIVDRINALIAQNRSM